MKPPQAGLGHGAADLWAGVSLSPSSDSAFVIKKLL